jgi:NitT/TauT family transport system permease protein
MKKPSPLLLWVLPVVSGLAFFLIWYGVKALFQASDWLLPTPAQIFAAAWSERERLWPAAVSTAAGALSGFVLAATLGSGFGLLLALSRRLKASLYPWLLVLQMTPVIVLTPIIQLWIGAGMPGIVTITLIVSIFPIVVNVTQGLLSADLNHVALFRMYNASRWQELFLLRVPTALPYFLTGLRIAAALAPVGAIFGEYMVGNASGGSGGLGFLVYSYNTQIKIPALFATALTSCLLGFVFVAAVSLLNWAVLHKWHDSFEEEDH